MMTDNTVTDARYLEITLVNGTIRKFAYASLGGDSATFATRLKQILEAQELILQLDDRVIIIPFANIQSLELVPRPDMNIPHSINVLHEFKD